MHAELEMKPVRNESLYPFTLSLMRSILNASVKYENLTFKYIKFLYVTYLQANVCEQYISSAYGHFNAQAV